MQKRRETLESQERENRNNLHRSKNELKQAISNHGYSVMLPKAIADFRILVDGLRERNELPADIKRTFVVELLERQLCICGAELHEGSPNFEQERTTTLKNFDLSRFL